MSMDKYFQWERMTLADLIVIMIKFLDFDSVVMETSSRPDVASRVWFRITVKRNDENHFVDGQTIEKVHRRLIELLDEQKMREQYLKSKEGE
jgi:hypothetical protein